MRHQWECTIIALKSSIYDIKIHVHHVSIMKYFSTKSFICERPHPIYCTHVAPCFSKLKFKLISLFILYSSWHYGMVTVWINWTGLYFKWKRFSMTDHKEMYFFKGLTWNYSSWQFMLIFLYTWLALALAEREHLWHWTSW